MRGKKITDSELRKQIALLPPIIFMLLTIEAYRDRLKNPPAVHQVEGINFLLERDYGALFDEQGTGKSYQMVVLACILYEVGRIDTVLIVAPSGVRTVWSNAMFGEIKEHSFVPGYISEYHGRTPNLLSAAKVKEAERLYWVVTNYEFLRQKNRLDSLVHQLQGRRVMIVADESSFIKSPKAKQTKALWEVRRHCDKAYILNGTPVSSTHAMDLYAQMYFLNPRILRQRSFYGFRNRYAIMGGYMNKQIIGVQNMEELNALVKPHVLRRVEEECNDLPERSYSIMEVPLSAENWNIYVEMRDQMISWLSDGTISKSEHAITKLIRLEQITSGYIGGLQPSIDPDDLFAEEVSKLDFDKGPKTKEIGTEKLDAIQNWIESRVQENPRFRAVIFWRFRAEQARAAERLPWEVLRIYGGQNKKIREEHVQRFGQTDSTKPMILLAQPQAGGYGLNLQKYCHNVMYASNDYSMITRSQSEKRVHRRGQTQRVVVTDVLATGPQGQKTINHIIHKALRKKLDFAQWTTDQWRAELEAE